MKLFIAMALAIVFAPVALADTGTIAPGALSGLMVTPRDVKAAIGTDVKVLTDGAGLVDVTTNRPDCGGVVFSSNENLAGQGHSAEWHRALWDHPGWSTVVEQSAVLFDDHDQAEAFVQGDFARWWLCANQTLTASVTLRGGKVEDQTYDVEQPFAADDIRVVRSTWRIAEEHRYGFCEHALVAAQNAAISLRTCSTAEQTGDSAVDLLRKAVLPRVGGVA